MKLKYKKIIMLTAMSTMGIGLLTLAISQDRPRAEESVNTDIKKEEQIQDESYQASMLGPNSMLDADDISSSPRLTPTSTPTPTPSPTPTPIPVYGKESDESYPEIKKLFENYYAAKNNCDVDKLKSILSDQSKAETVEQLQSMTEYIEDYRNIKCYIKKSYEKNSYIVFVYHEIKFTNINTLAPGLSKFYVVTGEDGELKIFSGQMDEQLQAYYNARNDDEDFKEIITMTENKSLEAKESDEDLAKFWESIDELASQIAQETDTQGDAEE